MSRPTSVLALYGPTEGQTRKIARFLSGRLAARGCATTLVDAALIAASLHLGRCQAAVEHFVRRHRAALAAFADRFGDRLRTRRTSIAQSSPEGGNSR